ncbi:MAG: ATP-dependent 6-phosphofructokinase, partial [Candidatus Fimadaptatus sp.]
MNAAVRAVVRTALYFGMSVVGVKRGYNGLLRLSPNATDDFEELDLRKVGDIIHRGGTFLKTARCEEFLKIENQRRAIANLRTLNVEGLICIGGDGTFAGAGRLNDMGFPTIGIPGTIDNDLPFSDMSIGYDTALNTICENINRIRETSMSHDRISIIEVMGRHCGDLALNSGLACGAEVILMPEAPWSIEGVVNKIVTSIDKGKMTSIIVVAEGAWDSMAEFDMERFGDEMGITLPPLMPDERFNSQLLARILQAATGQETRATVLGYLQRGGSPTVADRNLASRLGARAVELLRDGVSGQVVGIR